MSVAASVLPFANMTQRSWDDGDTSERLNYKIAEYSKAVLLDKPNFHISFIMNVSPECDCWNHNDAAIVPDLGIAASFDPVLWIKPVPI